MLPKSQAIEPYEFVVIGSRVPITQENRVEFHLLYSGSLHSERYEKHLVEKHLIRRQFHQQLRRLWGIHPNLRKMAEWKGREYYTEEVRSKQIENRAHLSMEEMIQKGLKGIGENWHRYGFNCVPLVTAELCLRCSLEIIFLRVEEKNYVLQGGDIDRRLSVLFDALRIPKERNELPPGTVPEADEDPFFCLLEGDELISEVRVSADQLLRLPEPKSLDKHDAYLQVTVKLNTTQPHQFQWVF